MANIKKLAKISLLQRKLVCIDTYWGDCSGFPHSHMGSTYYLGDREISKREVISLGLKPQKARVIGVDVVY
jgi:hypothetical protein